MNRVPDRDDAAGRRSRPHRSLPGLMILAAVAFAPLPPCRAQAPKAEKADRPAPPPEVVNAEKAPKQPPDAIDGPPYTTVKAWAIADGRTAEVLWGHREKEALEPASTTKIMTALIVVRQMAKDPKVGDEIVAFSKR